MDVKRGFQFQPHRRPNFSAPARRAIGEKIRKPQNRFKAGEFRLSSKKCDLYLIENIKKSHACGEDQGS
jgi:hypothetical protein